MSNPAGAAELWSPPPVHGPAVSVRRDHRKEASRAEKAAYDEAFAQGKAAGTAAGLADYESRNSELSSRIQRLNAILNVLAKPLSELDAQVERQLLTLSLTVARHLVRRELRVDPAQVIAIIRETVALLPAAARNVRVHLHPDDAKLVRELLSEPQTERAWTVVEDPVTSRGGCRVTTETANVDARLETRLGQVIAQVLGSERAEQREETP